MTWRASYWCPRCEPWAKVVKREGVPTWIVIDGRMHALVRGCICAWCKGWLYRIVWRL